MQQSRGRGVRAPAGPSVFDDAGKASRRPRDQSGSSACCAPLRAPFPQKSASISRARSPAEGNIYCAVLSSRGKSEASEGILHSAGRSSPTSFGVCLFASSHSLFPSRVFHRVFPATPAPSSSLEGTLRILGLHRPAQEHRDCKTTCVRRDWPDSRWFTIDSTRRGSVTTGGVGKKVANGVKGTRADKSAIRASREAIPAESQRRATSPPARPSRFCILRFPPSPMSAGPVRSRAVNGSRASPTRGCPSPAVKRGPKRREL